MAKYKVVMEAKDISQPDKIVRLVALNHANARELSEMRNKKHMVSNCIRVGADTISVEQELLNIRDQYKEAMHEKHDMELATRLRDAFNGTVDNLHSHMDVVAWQMTEKRLPVLTATF